MSNRYRVVECKFGQEDIIISHHRYRDTARQAAKKVKRQFERNNPMGGNTKALVSYRVQHLEEGHPCASGVVSQWRDVPYEAY